MAKRPSLPSLCLEPHALWNHNITKILDHLYVGAEDVPAQSNLLRSLNITHVVNAQCVARYQHGQEPEYVQLNCRDDVDEKILSKFEQAFNVIDDARKKGAACVVHCRNGMSRSATIVIAYLMRAKGWSLIDSFRFVRERRPCVSPNPGFMRQLAQFERVTLGTQTLDVQKYEDDRFGAIEDLKLRPAAQVSAQGPCGSPADKQRRRASPDKRPWAEGL